MAEQSNNGSLLKSCGAVQPSSWALAKPAPLWSAVV